MSAFIHPPPLLIAINKLKAKVSWKDEAIRQLKHYESEYLNVPAAAAGTLLHPKYKHKINNALTKVQTVGRIPFA